MRPVRRDEVLDLGAYEQIRPRFRERVIQMKKHRRISVGDHMTFVFENRDTVLLQIQEMIRTERITKEKAILHELETYNSMVPGDGELFATLLIEYDDKEERAKALDAMANLRDHVFLQIGDQKAPGEFELLPGEEDTRLPAVNYVRFRVGDGAVDGLKSDATACLVVDHPHYEATAVLSKETRAQLIEDLEEP